MRFSFRSTLWGFLAAVLVASGVVGASAFRSHSASASTTTTTRPVAPEEPEAGWTVATRSSRGVMVDYRLEKVDGLSFRVLRLRARTTGLRWHVGSQDPPTTGIALPADAASAVDWNSEGLAGVLAVFNGGFKVPAKAGGSMVDGVVLSPLVVGDMTIALNRSGQWSMGIWGSKGFPAAGFDPISLRQNLGPLVMAGRIATSALDNRWGLWGDPLHGNPAEARTGMGEDARGNLVVVATMQGSLPVDVARALVAAGVRRGMELDMNPFWPIIGASFGRLHHPGAMPVQLPYAEHGPSIYFTGWERDFFVAYAQPNAWRCTWASPGLRPGRTGVQPQPLRLEGQRCTPTVPTTTTTSAPPSTSTSTTPPTGPTTTG